MKQITVSILAVLFLGLPQLQADNLYSEREDLSILDIDAQFEDVKAEQMRFQKKTLKADEKRLNKEALRIEAKLRATTKRNLILEEEIQTLSEKVQKMQANVDTKTAAHTLSRDKHQTLSIKRAQLREQVKPTQKKLTKHVEKTRINKTRERVSL